MREQTSVCVNAAQAFMGEKTMERLKGKTEERLGVWAVGSPETSVIFNSPDRRVAPTIPAVLIIPDIITSYFGCRGWQSCNSSWQEDDNAEAEGRRRSSRLFVKP